MPKRKISNNRMDGTSFVLPCCWLLLVMVLALPSSISAWMPHTTTTTRFTRTGRLHTGLPRTNPLAVVLRMAQEDEPSSHHHHSTHPASENRNDNDEAATTDDNNEYEYSQPQEPRSSSSNNLNVTRDVLKKVRVAKAQAEIDRILQGPDPPFDTETELEKVISMSHIPSEQPLLDAEIAQLESELYEAVKQQDFTLASSKKQELGQLQKGGLSASSSSSAAAAAATGDPGGSSSAVDDGGAILQVNAAFYRAFSQKSWPDMERVWLRHDGDTSVCIHPSHKPLIGARRISNSWKQMFASTDGSFQRNWMEPHKIRVVLKGSHLAIVTCEEHVFARRFVRGTKRQTELINKLLATNIFRKVNQQWYMCYHHASWHPESEAAKRALSFSSSDGDGISGSRVVSESEYRPTSSLAATLAARRRRRRRELEDEEDEDDDTMVGMNGIFGNNFGPILGDGKPKESTEGGGGRPNKRFILGASLSDLLNGGLGGLMGGEANGKGPSDPNNMMGHGLPQEGAIIHFSRIEDDDDDEDDEDDLDMDQFDDEEDVEEDDDSDEDDEDDSDNEGESVAIIKEWAKSSSQASRRSSSRNRSGGSTANADKKNGKVFKDALRQNCISALRKLCDQGSIAPKQKRVLLTDIITCSSKGEFSMVEVAYELLCSEGDSDEEDTAEEEFAEQCRVFAQELLMKHEKQML